MRGDCTTRTNRCSHTIRTWVLHPVSTEFTFHESSEIVSNTEITQCTHSDHDIVSAFLTFEDTPRGKGTWHLNCKILHSNTFSDAVAAFWPAWRERKNHFLPSLSGGMWGNKKSKPLLRVFPYKISRRSRKTLRIRR